MCVDVGYGVYVGYGVFVGIVVLVGTGVYVGIGVAVNVGVGLFVGVAVGDGVAVGVGVLSAGTPHIVPASLHCSPLVVPPSAVQASAVLQVLGCWHEIGVGDGSVDGEGEGVGVFVTSGIQVFDAVAIGPSPHELIGVTLHL